MTHWHDRQPIFRQLADQITQQILQGVWKEGEALPSVRSISADMKINHLTVMKGYQLLVDEGLVEKKRGQGMFVAQGAIQQLRSAEKARFLEQQIPQIADTLQRLDMSVDELVQQLNPHMKGDQ
ncbi:GntR family transcriptional regulator [Vibrio parahaemolyticus]|uniref:GntR family transcriptional regulator n=4 Tax=Vibrio TaxID=662 RepID=A0A7Y0SDZ4_VIBPH|nr:MULTISPECIES: GntR family transcriptional regulator [Vibrio]EFO35581.1 transcriptional regulator GntR family [Vibrio parahaemolyticus Peru-466]EFO49961.1 transcriptional regulator GntR family [Vibrio parahaemolyticus K5030]EJG0873424.1 GntR family transcriptional regulator [Vibrio parahaemolyticus O3]EJG0902082.1 GntR family transcriptional regulator [Vibrio parahaemolyticus O3:K56]EJG0949970.1 GntR family transcriptional regulator [Vibrio parahaemolyticus O1:K58]EJG1064741.1 GntR family t